MTSVRRFSLYSCALAAALAFAGCDSNEPPPDTGVDADTPDVSEDVEQADGQDDVEPDVEEDTEPDVEADVEPDVEEDTEPDIVEDTEPDVEPDVVEPGVPGLLRSVRAVTGGQASSPSFQITFTVGDPTPPAASDSFELNAQNPSGE